MKVFRAIITLWLFCVLRREQDSKLANEADPQPHQRLSVWQCFSLGFTVFAKFSPEVGLSEARAIPVQSDHVHGGNTAMGISGNVMSCANHERICARIEGIRPLLRLKVRIPQHCLSQSQAVVRYREDQSRASLAGTAPSSEPGEHDQHGLWLF